MKTRQPKLGDFSKSKTQKKKKISPKEEKPINYTFNADKYWSNVLHSVIKNNSNIISEYIISEFTEEEKRILSDLS